jgi:tetratricopeptide (TPR) repeat protein
MSSNHCAAWFVAFFVAASGSPARGQPPDDGPAKVHVDRGMKAYRLGDCDRAIEELTRAHQIDPAPTVLYHIAECHQKKGEHAEALSFYRGYLLAHPGAADRELVEDRVRWLEMLGSPNPAPPRPPGPPSPVAPVHGGVRYWEPGSGAVASGVAAPMMASPPTVRQVPAPIEIPPEPPFYRRPLFWGVVGAAVVTAAAVVFFLRPRDHWTCEAADCLSTRTVP